MCVGCRRFERGRAKTRKLYISSNRSLAWRATGPNGTLFCDHLVAMTKIGQEPGNPQGRRINDQASKDDSLVHIVEIESMARGCRPCGRYQAARGWVTLRLGEGE
jgi:hypothetical protein